MVWGIWVHDVGVALSHFHLGGFRLIPEIWRSVFPDLLTLSCFAFCLVMGTVDLVEKDTNAVVFWTCDEEKSCVFFQIGTSNAVPAVQAASLV